jgi:hypothetical protein
VARAEAHIGMDQLTMSREGHIGKEFYFFTRNILNHLLPPTILICEITLNIS